MDPISTKQNCLHDVYFGELNAPVIFQMHENDIKRNETTMSTTTTTNYFRNIEENAH